MNDNVNHPEHYTSGGIECIDAIRASLGDKEFADYCKGNIIKYLWRYRHKNGVEDLRKAQVYLNWMIEAEERTEETEEKKDGLYTSHEVAVIIADLFGDACACNFNNIDEWLPLKCELLGACPDPGGVACWEQYVKHRNCKDETEGAQNGETD